MKKLTLLLICVLSINAQAGGFTDSDGTLTDYVNPSVELNLSPADVFAACKVADLITTKIAFAKGAVEGNALIVGLSGGTFAGAVLVGVAAISLVYWMQHHYGQEVTTGINIASAITCGVAGHNLFVN